MSSQVTERHLGLGSFTVDLVEDTPADVRRALTLAVGATTSKAFGLVVVTPQRVDQADYPPPATPATTPHPLLTAARWAGVLLETDRRRTQLAGAGLLALLGDEDGAGHVHIDLADKRAKAQASTLISRLIDGGTLPNVIGSGGAPGDVSFEVSPLRAGTITTGGTSLNIGDQLLTTRQWLEDVSARAGRRSYRVRPTGHLDWGPRSTLFGITPRVIVGRLPARHDPKWVTVRTEADWSESVAGFADQAVGDPGPTEAGSALSPGPVSTSIPSTAFWSPIRAAAMRRRVEVPLEDDEVVADWRTRAGEILDAGRNASVIASKELDGVIEPARALEPGEPIYLWDPAAGLIDTGNAITYAGEQLHPVARYLDAVTWPIVQGMGIFLLYIDQAFGGVQRVLDLTDYVEVSTSAQARLEVGDSAPTL